MCHWRGPFQYNFSVIPLVSSLPNPKFAAMAEGSDLSLTNYLEEVDPTHCLMDNSYDLDPDFDLTPYM
jgi:hypothetical protein